MKSESIMLVLVTALISGLLGSVLTILWQRHYESRRLKLHIFETLMAYRYLIWSQESVNAINSVAVVTFHHLWLRLGAGVYHHHGMIQFLITSLFHLLFSAPI